MTYYSIREQFHQACLNNEYQYNKNGLQKYVKQKHPQYIDQLDKIYTFKFITKNTKKMAEYGAEYVDKLNRQVTDLKADNRDFKKDIENRNNQIDKFKAKLASVEEAVQKANTNNSELQKQLNEVQNELSACKGKLTESEDKIAEYVKANEKRAILAKRDREAKALELQ